MTKLVNKLNHTELCTAGGRIMRNYFGCGVVATELSSFAVESPDVFGFKQSGLVTFLFEAKTSRSDFFADAKKTSRKAPSKGVGLFRYYLTPPGLISIDELPLKWGLIEINHRNGIHSFHGKNPKSQLGDEFAFRERSSVDELAILYSISRRQK